MGATYQDAEDVLTELLFGGATWYMRLLTQASGKGTVGTETAFGSYARLACVFDGTLWSAPGLTARSSNLIDLLFPQATTVGAGNIVGFDFVNTASGAFTDRRLYGLITPSRAVVVGKRIRFRAGVLVVTS